jgi:hypothetical protein
MDDAFDSSGLSPLSSSGEQISANWIEVIDVE